MRRLLLIGALTALTLAACGGGDGDGGSSSSGDNGNGGDAPGAGGDIDLCGLLTTAEIEAAVGNRVEEGTPDVGNACDWGSENDISVSVYLLVGATQDQCVAALEGDAAYAEASGFDAPAFSSYNEAAGGLADVVVCTDEGQFQLIVSGGIDDVADEQHLSTAADDLTSTALERL
jgi:hypothetical protein